MERYYLRAIINILPLGYIDPGTGSMLLQFIISVSVGIILFFRRTIGAAVFWIRNKLFRNSSEASNKKSSEEQA